MKRALKIVGIIFGSLLIIIAAIFCYALYKVKHIKDPHNLQAQVDSLCTKYINEQKSAGLFVGIVQGDTLYAQGYGVTDKDSKTVPDSNTVFEIGSISKVFTTAIAQSLVERGQLNWSDNIIQYLPVDARPPVDDNTTLMHLATHTSGFPGLPEAWFPKLEQNECDPYSLLTMQDVFSYLKSGTEKKKPTDASYSYSNFGMGLLGHILEIKSGKTYESLLQEQICQPLQMLHTSTSVVDTGKFATGHDKQGKKTCHWNFPILAGAGAIKSTGADMLRFLKANMSNSTPISKALMATHGEIAKSPTGAIGYGWHIDKLNGALFGIYKIVWHNGGTGGFRSYMGFIPGRNRGVIVFANQTNEDFDELAIKIMIKAGTVSLK